MKRVATITADDGRQKLKIRVELVPFQLTRDEADKMVREIIRNTAKGLEPVSYSDFGIDNIRIRGVR